MSTQPVAGALRAAARVQVSGVLGRSRRVIEYDAKYPDGRVELNVDADTVLQGRRFPDRARKTRAAADAACPETGTGPWVEHETDWSSEETEALSGTTPWSHRKPGPARTTAPDEPPETFGQALWNHPRLVLLEVGRAAFELLYGWELALDGESVLLRLLGLGLFAFGLIHVASYVLKFLPRVLAREQWSRTVPRQIARAVLQYAWVAAGIGWGIAQYIWDA
ncbi:hypothetical protein [Aeromicrobium sp. NPDC092404]|uniref:hypothetical protein n=1 Tax=Aeromicrobium sp. NPDC092404 TaxID=3154976 RepID=UPI00342E9985